MTDRRKKAGEDEEAKTPRTCAACGGRGCKWCTLGFQDEEQQKAWASFRSRMRKISSTYSLLEKVVRELVDGLTAVGEHDLAEDGRRNLQAWLEAAPDSQERREASMKISLFQSQAVVAIMKSR